MFSFSLYALPATGSGSKVATMTGNPTNILLRDKYLNKFFASLYMRYKCSMLALKCIVCINFLLDLIPMRGIPVQWLGAYGHEEA